MFITNVINYLPDFLIFRPIIPICTLILIFKRQIRTITTLQSINIMNRASFYEELVDRLPDFYYQTDTNGVITFASKAVEIMFGYKKEEIVGKNLSEFVKYKDKYAILESDLNQKKEVYNYEAFIRHKNQSFIPISANIKLLFNSNNEVIGQEGLVRNNSEVKILEKELITLNEILNESHHIANVGYWLIDFQNKTATISNNGKLLLKIAKNNYDLDSFYNLFTFVEKNKLYNAIGRAKSTNKITSLLIKFNQQILSLRIKIFSVNDQIAICTFQDVTEFKEMENKLIESVFNISSIIESTSDIIFSLNKVYQLENFNSAFKKFILNEYNIEVKPGDNFFNILPEKIVKDWQEIFVKAEKDKNLDIDYTYKNKNNFTQYWEMSINTIEDAFNNMAGFACFAKDRTELITKTSALKEANKELETFIHKTSHDLKSPISSGLGLINLAKMNKKADEESLQYFNMIGLSLSNLNSILSDLTEIALIKQGQLDIKEINISECIEKQINAYAFNPQYSDTSIIIDMNQSLLLNTDPIYLNTILRNIIDNAYKYAHVNNDEPRVTIKAVRPQEKKYLLVTVSNNGASIPHEKIDKIFEMFYRAQDTVKGTGLGLYIVKTALNKIQGTVEVTSSKKTGTTFRIILPNLS